MLISAIFLGLAVVITAIAIFIPFWNNRSKEDILSGNTGNNISTGNSNQSSTDSGSKTPWYKKGLPTTTTPSILLGLIWILSVIALYSLNPVWCEQAITRYPGLVLGFHAILLTFALMWRKEGSNAGKWLLTIVLVVAFLSALGGKNLLPKVPSFTTGQKRMVVGRPKQEPVVLTSTFKLKPGEYVGPIKAPSETEPWRIEIVGDKNIHVRRMDRHGKLIWESDMGPDIPYVNGPGAYPGSSYYITALKDAHEIQVSWQL